MKTALVCIAKNEDHYIDEWLQYHLKLGFSSIFVYLNNWRYAGSKSVYGSSVVWIDFDGEAMLMKAYNDFIDKHSSEYDFAAFFDVDEFLCLKKDKSLDNFLSRYTDIYGVGVNWRVFGDNGLTSVESSNYSLLNRFTKCLAKLDRHIKTILNLMMSKNMFHFVNPHFIDASLKYDVILDVDKTHAIHGPWNENCLTLIALLNHYHSKTWPEFQEKMARGKADTLKSHPRYNYLSSDFMLHNYNDIEDTTARDFYYGTINKAHGQSQPTMCAATAIEPLHVFSICTPDYVEHTLELAYSMCMSNTMKYRICFTVVVDGLKTDLILSKLDLLSFPCMSFKVVPFDAIYAKHREAIDTLLAKTSYPRIVFAKLYLVDLMPRDANAALYIDSDTIVVDGSILDILATDFTLTREALMACYDLPIMLSDSAELESASTRAYFNTGVFVVNKNAFNRIDVDALALSLDCALALKYADLTFINLVFRGNIRPLHPKFNVMVKDFCHKDPSLVCRYAGVSYEGLKQMASVLHFAGGFCYWHDFSRLPLSYVANIDKIKFAIDAMAANKHGLGSLLLRCGCSSIMD